MQEGFVPFKDDKPINAVILLFQTISDLAVFPIKKPAPFVTLQVTKNVLLESSRSSSLCARQTGVIISSKDHDNTANYDDNKCEIHHNDQGNSSLKIYENIIHLCVYTIQHFFVSFLLFFYFFRYVPFIFVFLQKTT